LTNPLYTIDYQLPPPGDQSGAYPMKRILVVEDEEALRKLYAELFKTIPDYQARLAANGQEALDFILESCPDILLCDVNMPVMGGIELLERLQEVKEIPPIIVLVSGSFTEQLRERALECGASAVLIKTSLEKSLEVVERLAAGL